ncbi:bifunctional DNA primase/polymerase [Chitinophaga filiformis]|uniref:Bifunctional DNA primase/polymerase n=1 Tax=Chitinophaga filiformis TaxID=104663 RepID=A0ABY4HW49_CHIFI|nr:bifunctional DNA primase/polymerase [Chitinophaga filiformis]UPK68017.1 bifunctional DNA primase/polymerase [Chitinophaga filiformis]
MQPKISHRQATSSLWKGCWLWEKALTYASIGYSPIAVGTSKRPCVKWRPYQQSPATAATLRWMFSLPPANGIALVCGAVSGGLEVIDIDCKHALDQELFAKLWSKILQYSPSLAAQLVVARTRSGGYHLYYRCDQAGSNAKLASRPTTTEERRTAPNQPLKVLIETRGEKGYVVAPPTPGYAFIQGDLYRVPLISATDRLSLLTIAKSFNLVPEKKWTPAVATHRSTSCDDPLTDYNARGDVIALLLSYGWTIVGQDGERTLVKRPGDTDSYSSGNYHHGLRCFKVFSTSTQFEHEVAYRPSAVFAILACNGDFREAARRLLKMGYGKARLAQYRPQSPGTGRKRRR